jgi:tetratricopeptide (TPR) repeat protein
MGSDPQGAIRALNNYLQTAAQQPDAEPPSAALDYTLGSLYLQSGDVEAAIRAYRASLEKFATFQRAHQNLGLALVQSGKFEEALPSLLRALELGGGNGILWGLIGFAYLNSNYPTQALAAYEQALLFQPQSRDWQLGKLNAALNAGQRPLAIAMLNEMLADQPQADNLWLQQANAFLGEGQTMEAAVNLEAVARMGKASVQSQLLLGDIFLSEQLPDLALDAYIGAMELGTVDNERLLRVAERFLQFGAHPQAGAFLTTVQDSLGEVMSADEQLKVLNLQAQLAVLDGDMQRAAELLEQVIARDPLNGQALLTLGDFHRDAGDLQRAIFHYERATRVDGVKVRALLALARVHVANRDFRAAITALNEAQSIEPRAFVAEYIDQLERLVRRG